MADRVLDSQEIMEILRTTPARVEAIIKGTDPDRLAVAPGVGAWSGVELLAHLRSCADVWGAAMVTILTEDAPTFRAINPLSWVLDTDYAQRPFAPSWRQFKAQRAELIEVLDQADGDAWFRTATVTGAGRPLVRQVTYYGNRMARHERGHLRQFEQIVAALS